MNIINYFNKIFWELDNKYQRWGVYEFSWCVAIKNEITKQWETIILYGEEQQIDLTSLYKNFKVKITDDGLFLKRRK